MASSSWTFAPGRHKVEVGPSFKRALKARRGEAAVPKRSGPPDREFYSVRYPFKPSSIDTTQPGNLEVKRGNDASSSSVIVNHPSTQPGEVHEFSGNESAAKDWACALIYDEDTGRYTLEKVESFIALEHPQRKFVSTSARLSPNPPHRSSNSSKNPTPPPIQEDADADADFEEILPDSLLVKPTMDIEEEDIPLISQVAPPPAPTQRPAKKSPVKSTRTEAPSPATKPAAKTTTQVKPKKPAKRQTPTFSDGEDEVLEFGRPTKRTRPSPTPPVETKRAPSPPPDERRLELPGMSSSYAHPLPAPAALANSTSRKATTSSSSSRQPPPPAPSPPPASPPPTAAPDSDEEEEDYWREVAATAPSAPSDGGQEIDVDEFETLMNEHLEEDEEEDFLAAVVGGETETPEPEIETPRISGLPISMKDLAGLDSNDEDDYSSSDESDDD